MKEYGPPPPGLAAALPPSENCRPNRKERRDAARSRGPPRRWSSGWPALGRIRAVRKISIPITRVNSLRELLAGTMLFSRILSMIPNDEKP
jgi:hypothetical protein